MRPVVEPYVAPLLVALAPMERAFAQAELEVQAEAQETAEFLRESQSDVKRLRVECASLIAEGSACELEPLLKRARVVE